MTTHLTIREMELLASDKLPPAELLAVDRHLQECGGCRASVADLSGMAASVAKLRRAMGDFHPGEHLSYEELAGHADDTLIPRLRSKAESHLEACAECRREITQFAALRSVDELEPAALPGAGPGWFHPLPSLLLWRSAGFAAAVVFVVAVAITFWFTIRNSEDERRGELASDPIANLAVSNGQNANVEVVGVSAPEAAGTAPEENKAPAEPAPDIAFAVRDGGETIGLSKSERLVGYESLPAKYRQLMESSLRTQNVPTGPELNDVRSPTGTLMGIPESAGTDSFRIKDPVGKIVASDRPPLSWERLPGAESYMVEVFDTQFNKIAASGALESTTWTPKLNRGETYVWQVTATKEGKEIKSPRRPAPEAKFRILERETFTEIENLKRRHPRSNLLLGLLYAKSGLVDEAVQSLREVLKENPNSPTARKLLRQVQIRSSRQQ